MIRKAERKDIPRLIELFAAHAAYEQASFSTEGKEVLLFKHFEKIQCWVVELDGKIEGYTTCIKQFSTWDVAEYVYLDCLFLTEATRGKGYGAQLMEKVKEYAKREGCAEVQWQTPDFNTKAIEFYKKLGASSKTKERFFWVV
ncbi:N-acetyltransferase family protein [Wenyingzhuangia sp. IMCC45574]